jgi:hypothetical protein
MTLDFDERSDAVFASAVTSMVGPITHVRYMRSWAEKEGSSRDSVAKYPAVMMTMSRWVIFCDSRY